MPKIDIDALPEKSGSNYPAPFKAANENRFKKALGDAVGLTQFGVNLTRLPPSSGTALLHWHENEDELVYILEGEAILIEDDGETVLKPGDAAGFKAGIATGHCIENRSDHEVVLLEIGTRAPTERGHYPGVDLAVEKDKTGVKFTHKSGEPYT